MWLSIMRQWSESQRVISWSLVSQLIAASSVSALCWQNSRYPSSTYEIPISVSNQDYKTSDLQTTWISKRIILIDSVAGFSRSPIHAFSSSRSRISMMQQLQDPPERSQRKSIIEATNSPSHCSFNRFFHFVFFIYLFYFFNPFTVRKK